MVLGGSFSSFYLIPNILNWTSFYFSVISTDIFLTILILFLFFNKSSIQTSNSTDIYNIYIYIGSGI